MSVTRPDPDDLLKALKPVIEGRGKLKVFIGASPGVGKTYAMLSEAHEKQNGGLEVAVGYVETHGRRETEDLVAGLKVVPRRATEYRGTSLLEVDVDEVIGRKPALVLIDELAHSNAPGSRHAKRWQDVEDVLSAGIDVYTAVNIRP